MICWLILWLFREVIEQSTFFFVGAVVHGFVTFRGQALLIEKWSFSHILNLDHFGFEEFTPVEDLYDNKTQMLSDPDSHLLWCRMNVGVGTLNSFFDCDTRFWRLKAVVAPLEASQCVFNFTTSSPRRGQVKSFSDKAFVSANHFLSSDAWLFQGQRQFSRGST